MKKTFSIILVILFCLLFSSQSFAFGNGSNFKKGEVCFKTKDYGRAVSFFNKVVDEDPENPEAYFMLGRSYLGAGYTSKARDAFKSAIIIDATYNLSINKGILYLDVGRLEDLRDVFDKLVAARPGLRVKIGRQIFSLAMSWAKQKIYNKADKIFKLSLEYDPSLNRDIFVFFFEEGESLGGYDSVELFNRALGYSDREQEIAIGKKFLKIACEERRSLGSYQRKELKEKARRLVGDDLVKKVFPGVYFKDVISRRFSGKDANSEGWIRVISWSTDELRVDDTIYITWTAPDNSLVGLSYYNDLGNWAPISKSGKKIKVIFIPQGKKYLYILLEKGSGVLAKVRVSRKIVGKVNDSLVKNF